MSEEDIYQNYIKISQKTDIEMNSLSYKEAVKNDKRTNLTYYISLIRSNHILFFSFIPTNDYNSQILKIFIFFFNFTTNFLVNALFFNDTIMIKIYSDGGSFDFIYNIPQILYSSLVSGFINNIIKTLALSSSNIIQLKLKRKDYFKEGKVKEVFFTLKIKFVLFFFACFLLLIVYWIYLACFCAVYKNTQFHLIKDTVISFGAAMIYPFGISLIPGFFRFYAIKAKNKECLFSFSQLLQSIL